ncbi:hypothetical protein PUN28_011993 [Cardiocondyla obscurior]|uniref:Uncharacterized protein n=1 Tax=Cardiocondyla obscurior TaxID=286306 RepID=A0AAW2FCR7_9HYME
MRFRWSQLNRFYSAYYRRRVHTYKTWSTGNAASLFRVISLFCDAQDRGTRSFVRHIYRREDEEGSRKDYRRTCARAHLERSSISIPSL